MSRIGKKPIPLPAAVNVSIHGRDITVESGGKRLSLTHRPEIKVSLSDDPKQIVVEREDDSRTSRAMHGLTRALINNMILGVSEGYEKTLEIQGVGYRASLQGKNLNLALGFSHPVIVEPPAGIEFEVDGTNIIKVIGIDKQQVGQVAANVRAWRKPEPYKGKGIRYQGEHVRRKVGKAGVSTA